MKREDCKLNVKIYEKYRMFSYDFLFYYAILIMFFSITKKLSMSEIMIISAIYSFSAFIWQVPVNFIVQKLGLKKSIVIGNILVLIEIIGYILFSKIYGFIIVDFFGALGWSLKGVSESSILYTSLKQINRKEDFSKIEGKSLSYFFILDSLSSAISGFLFVFNNYIPMVLCALNVVISIILSTMFVDVENDNDEIDKSVTLKSTFLQLTSILKTKRGISLLLFIFLFWGILSVGKKLYNAILIDIGVAEEMIAVILCFATIFISIGTKYSYKFEKIAQNKTLTIISILYVISIFFIGIIGYVNVLNLYTLSLYMICLVLICLVTGIYTVAIKRYILNFTNHEVRTKITSLYYSFKYIGESVFLGISSVILMLTNNSIAMLIFSCIAAVSCFVVLKFMRDKVGLSPEKYDRSEIYNVDIQKEN